MIGYHTRRSLNSLITAGALALTCLSQSATAQQAWVPVWADEFTGNSLNLTNWEYMLGNGSAYGNPGWGNNELQNYTSRPQNIGVSGGFLTITARAENYQGAAYTSARIRSQGRRDFRYGRMEGRIKVPAGQGIWPAFWMLPTNSPYGGWASSGEMDIIETVNAATSAHGTIHFGQPWPNNASNGGSRAGTWSDGFHVYAMEWEPDEIRWYVDGVQYHQVTSSQWNSSAAPDNDRAPFDHSFHFLLNLAVGGNWPGPPNGSTPFPAQLQVDYVRVFQRPAKGPYLGTPATLPIRIEAENFDLGGGSVAYFETEGANLGNQYRLEEAVDIQVCGEGGFNVGWFRPTEWMEYTVDAPRAGRYDLSLRVATQSADVRFRALANGVDVTGAVAIAPTATWQTYRTVRVSVQLPAGVQSIRIVNAGTSGRDFNFNWLEFGSAGDVDGNGVIDIGDLYALEGRFGTQGDIDGDGTPFTGPDRIALLEILRSAERANLLRR